MDRKYRFFSNDGGVCREITEKELRQLISKRFPESIETVIAWLRVERRIIIGGVHIIAEAVA